MSQWSQFGAEGLEDSWGASGLQSVGKPEEAGSVVRVVTGEVNSPARGKASRQTHTSSSVSPDLAWKEGATPVRLGPNTQNKYFFKKI